MSPWKQRQRKYASFLQSVVLPNATVFAYLVTFGEVLIGLGLIFGVLTGIAAFFGVFMNLNFLLALLGTPWTGTLAHRKIPTVSPATS